MSGPSCPPSCTLYAKGTGFALTDGTGSNGVLLVGEALGEAEARMSKPFCGDAGLMLGQVLRRLGYKREHFLIANRTCCRPPQNWMENAPWEAEAVESCRPFFDETLRRNPQIKVLVPMGNSAMHYLLGQKGVGNFHGCIQWHPGHEKWVVPTFHPSYLMRGNWSEIQTARFDLQRAVELARNPQHTIRPCTYLEHPSHTQALEFLAAYHEALQGNPSLVLAADIETPMSAKLDEDDAEESESYQIERISFAFRECEAITMPWEGQYVEVAKELLVSDGETTFWNGDRFDLPRLQAVGCTVTRTLDSQELFHFIYPDLPKKLGYCAPFFIEDCEPWKHLSAANPTFYSCRDSDYLLRIHNALVVKVKAAGRWASFEREIMECNRRTAQMSRNGIAINEPVRVEMVATEEAAAAHVHIEVQDLVPRELKPVHPKGGYKRPSPEGRCLAGHKLALTCEQCAATQGWSPEHLQAEGLRQIEVDEMAVIEGRQQVAKFLRWAKVDTFNLNSSKQMISYIEWKHGKKAVPKAKKTGKDTIERDQLERLAKKSGDPVLLLAIQSSIIGSKINYLNQWTPGSAGLVHCTFTNNPATFRFSSKKPNTQNFPGRTEEFKKMRRIVVPGKGYQWLVSRDYSSIEPIQVGLYSGDAAYLRVAIYGAHAYLASFMQGRPIHLNGRADSDLAAELAEVKQRTKKEILPGAQWSVYDCAKRLMNGSNNGMSDTMMNASYPEAFPTRKHAWATQQLLFTQFPKVYVTWRKALVDRAHREALLVNDFGYPRWLWFVKSPKKGEMTKQFQWTAEGGRCFEAFNWTWIFANIDKAVKQVSLKHPEASGGWRWEWTDEAKIAMTTLQQSSAAILMRRALASKEAEELANSGKLFLTIHDELIARAVDEDDAEQVSEQLRLAMEFAVPEQGGRVFRTAAKQGRDWSEVE